MTFLLGFWPRSASLFYLQMGRLVLLVPVIQDGKARLGAFLGLPFAEWRVALGAKPDALRWSRYQRFLWSDQSSQNPSRDDAENVGIGLNQFLNARIIPFAIKPYVEFRLQKQE